MSDNEILYCLIAFILGWFVSRMMGNGFSVGGDVIPDPEKRNVFLDCMRSKLQDEINESVPGERQYQENILFPKIADQCIRSCKGTKSENSACEHNGDCMFPTECNTKDPNDNTLKCNPGAWGEGFWMNKLIGCCSDYCEDEV